MPCKWLLTVRAVLLLMRMQLFRPQEYVVRHFSFRMPFLTTPGVQTKIRSNVAEVQ